MIYQNPQMRNSLTGSCKRVLLRDPISLKMAMAFVSLFLGVSLMFSKSIPPALDVMTGLLPMATWGSLFFVSGASRLAFLGGTQLFHRTAQILFSLLSLYLWVYLNISSFQSPSFDALNATLGATIVLEAWILVHTMFPHTDQKRFTDD